MLGIPDPAIWLGYLLTILSVVACVVFSVRYWNKSDSALTENSEEELKWEEKESELKKLV